ncbi:MAG: hypothetical protein P8090_09230 [Gammaproteobacteria bacterium]
MRNIFDQYIQPENRLTHALLSCFEADRVLLQRFVKWSAGRKVVGRQLDILEQSLPGDPPDLSDEEVQKRGLPDGCIVDKSGWALLIESKFQAAVTADQIRRHVRTAGRRGLTDCNVLILTVKPVRQRMARGIFVRQWTEVYDWLQREARRSPWARICRDYLEVAEAREAANGYLDKGTLTVFSGVPFGKDEPYTYPQAKRLLGLLRDELRHDRRLTTRLGVDPESSGRGAITGRSARMVWDFIGLKQARGAKQFTQYPHLTLGIWDDRLEAYVTVPNGICSRLRNNVLGENYEDFEDMIGGITSALMTVVRSAPGAVPQVVIVQRHYATQRAQGTRDCSLRFDPRTAVEVKPKDRGRVKVQPQWLRASYDALRSRRSNLQFQIGVNFPYDACPTVATRKIIRACADVWLACRPMIRAATEE